MQCKDYAKNNIGEMARLFRTRFKEHSNITVSAVAENLKDTGHTFSPSHLFHKQGDWQGAIRES